MGRVSTMLSGEGRNMHHFVIHTVCLLILHAEIQQGEGKISRFLGTQSNKDNGTSETSGTDVYKEYQKIQRQMSGGRESAPNDSCTDRCGLNNTRHGELLKCYCDRACPYLGDCCADYLKRCSASETSHEYEALKCIQPVGTYGYGVVMVAKCPKSGKMEQSCSGTGSDALTHSLPVVGSDKKIYKNVYCATCNGVQNWTFWNADATDCYGISSISEQVFWNMSSLIRIAKKLCLWRFTPSPNQTAFVQKCVPNFGDACKNVQGWSEIGYKYQKLCNLYSFVVCGTKLYKNPHCAFCEKSWHVGELRFDCSVAEGEDSTMIGRFPDLTIMFRFKNREARVLYNEKEVRITAACAKNEIYDPFENTCKGLYPEKKWNKLQGSLSRKKEQNDSLIGVASDVNLTSLRKASPCKRIFLRTPEYIILKNGSVFVKSHQKVYPKTRYTKQRRGILLCTNFSRLRPNVSGVRTTPKLDGGTLNPAKIITVVGGSISICSLLFLVITFSIFTELRTVPGKSTLNLSCALVMAYTLFLCAGKVTSNPWLCRAYSILLHYLWLASFSWMSVIGHDISRTFGSKVMTTRTVKNAPVVTEARKQFKRYALYGWGFPLALVLTFVVLDVSKLIHVGYGNPQYCWITEQLALILVFEIPVALILAYNAYALVLTLVALRRHHKTAAVTKMARVPRKLIICLKLTSVMGLTWVLGLGTSLTDSYFLVYPYLVLNSLQGSFIAVAFAMNKRVLKMYKTLAMTRVHKSNTSHLSTLGSLFIKKRCTVEIAQRRSEKLGVRFAMQTPHK